ncbi:haloacid dehalogenase [candidate division CSSED10-310 bacterium]|uniref:Haloacid dehalogenase n=1 Tax=candidate division CSSED10-310 bacterium TaxID=2855610 RepID=A0ABV6Z2R6_UNCC1
MAKPQLISHFMLLMWFCFGSLLPSSNAAVDLFPRNFFVKQCGDITAVGEQPPLTNNSPSTARLDGSFCSDSFAIGPATGWDHTPSEFIAASGEPNHNGHDVVATPGDSQSFWIEGKFAYGLIDKDMEDERVEVYLNDEECNEWRLLTSGRTNNDGRLTVPCGPPYLPPGPYAIKMVLRGDNSEANYFLRVWPPGTRVVVFDIDGTLTTSDFELVHDLFNEIYRGDYVPEMQAGAGQVVNTFYDKNYHIIYLTGRPYWLHQKTRQWLSNQGLAGGTVRLTDSNSASYPSRTRVGDYKAAFLQTLLAHGILIDYAYGNATTDIYAYQKVGIPDDCICIIGQHAGEQGTFSIESYLEHLEWVEQLEVVAQP